MDNDTHPSEDFLSKFLDGNWKPILSENTYQSLLTWFKENKKSKRVVVRFVVFDTERKMRFAVHLVCAPKIKKDIVTVLDRFIPSPETFDTSPHLLVALPPSLYELPLFCVPTEDADADEDEDEDD